MAYIKCELNVRNSLDPKGPIYINTNYIQTIRREVNDDASCTVINLPDESWRVNDSLDDVIKAIAFAHDSEEDF